MSASTSSARVRGVTLLLSIMISSQLTSVATDQINASAINFAANAMA